MSPCLRSLPLLLAQELDFVCPYTDIRFAFVHIILLVTHHEHLLAFLEVVVEGELVAGHANPLGTFIVVLVLFGHCYGKGEELLTVVFTFFGILSEIADIGVEGSVE